MYKRIIVPLDGSRLAEQVLPHAQMLATHLKTDIELVHVVVPLERSLEQDAESGEAQRTGGAGSGGGVDFDHLTVSMQGDARTYLARVAKSLSDMPAGSVSTAVLDGNAAERIIDEAAREPEWMIAMSTHGHTGFRHWLLGGVTDKVLQTTAVPLFVVRSSVEEPASANVDFKQILVPLDGSPFSERALPHARSFAIAFGIPIRLVRSIPSSAMMGTYVGINYEPPPSFYMDLEGDAAQYLEKIGQHLSKEGVSTVGYDVLHGDAASGILEVAEREPGTVVAMSTHGRSGISRWTLGSVADRVIGHLKMPVLVVRAFDDKS